jgi:hypothetical protein
MRLPFLLSDGSWRHVASPPVGRWPWEQPLREGAYRWLGTWLNNPRPTAKAPLKPDPPASLNVTKTGLLATSDGARTIRGFTPTRRARSRRLRLAS